MTTIERENVLSQFPALGTWSESDKLSAIRSPRIKSVISLALGPQGTNIALAADKWHQTVGIEDKARIILTDLPETAVNWARELDSPGTLPVFWTCAVFARLYRLFFEQPDILPFFFIHEMKLDEMQLAANPEDVETVRHLMLVKENMRGIRLASHISPTPLLTPLVKMGAKIIDVKSNADAAEQCRRQEVEACVTTRSACDLYSLKTLHSFGSPPMIFFGGITANGLRELDKTGC